MTPAFEAFNGLASAWARLAWAVAWQSMLLVVVFAIAARGLRRSAPGLRYWFWQIAAIKLLIMPLWGISILVPIAAWDRAPHVPSESSPPAPSGGRLGARPQKGPWTFNPDAAADGPSSRAQDGGLGAIPIDWRGWLLIGWVLAIAGQVGAIVSQRAFLKRLLRGAESIGDPALLALLAELSRRIGLRQPPALVAAEGGGSPFVCGLRRPTLVLPRGLAESLGPESLRSVLVHELAHLKRRDLLWDWITVCTRLLYPFHPAAHYIAYRAHLERELACDQAAMVLIGQGAAGYASTLVEVAGWTSAPPAIRAALESAHLGRIESCSPRDTRIEVVPSSPIP